MPNSSFKNYTGHKLPSAGQVFEKHNNKIKAIGVHKISGEGIIIEANLNETVTLHLNLWFWQQLIHNSTIIANK